jgi:hypothetical protein
MKHFKECADLASCLFRVRKEVERLNSELQDLMTEDLMITEDLVRLFGFPEETVYAVVGDYTIAVNRSVIVEQVADLTEAERVRYENL